jgi:hypothetical protein
MYNCSPCIRASSVARLQSLDDEQKALREKELVSIPPSLLIFHYLLDGIVMLTTAKAVRYENFSVDSFRYRNETNRFWFVVNRNNTLSKTVFYLY